jgi:hypothetical protein
MKEGKTKSSVQTRTQENTEHWRIQTSEASHLYDSAKKKESKKRVSGFPFVVCPRWP